MQAKLAIWVQRLGLRRLFANRRRSLVFGVVLALTFVGSATAATQQVRGKYVSFGNKASNRKHWQKTTTTTAPRITTTTGPTTSTPTSTATSTSVPTTTEAPATTASATTTTRQPPTTASTTTTTTTLAPRPDSTNPAGFFGSSGKAPVYVATNGNDAAAGTIDAPWRSLSVAFNRLQPGDTLIVRGGRYNAAQDEQFNIEGKNGAQGRAIVVAAYPNERPVIQLNSFWQGISIANSSYVEIKGLELIGTAPTDQRFTDGIQSNKSHHVRIAGNVVHDTGGCGICSINSNHVWIESNEVYGTSKWSPYQTSGISFFQSTNIGGGANADGYSMYINANRVHHNTNITKPGPGQLNTDGNCVIIDLNNDMGYSGRTLVTNNLCYENGGRGVHMLRSDNVHAINNTLVNNLRNPEIDGGELTAAFSSNILFRNNLASAARPGKGYINWDASVTTDRNMYFGQAPTLMSSTDQAIPGALDADLTAPAGSVAINGGSTQLAPQSDFRGTCPRTANPTWVRSKAPNSACGASA